MPYSEHLAGKVRETLSGLQGLTEKEMFGGIAFMLGGTMCLGIDKDDLIVRCPKEDTDLHLKKKGVRVFNLSGGRPMKGWLLVGVEATSTKRGFQDWVEFAIAHCKRAATPKATRKDDQHNTR